MLPKYEEVLAISLHFWKYTGASPVRFSPSRLILELIVLTMTLALTFWEYLLNPHDLKVMTDAVHSMNTIFHVMIFCIINIFKHEKQLTLLKDLNEFWDYDADPEFDKDFKNSLTDALMKLKRFLYIFRAYPTFVIFSLFVISYISPKWMMLPCHVPEFLNYYVFVTITNFAYVEGAMVLMGTDMFVLAVLFLLAMQFRILGRKLVSIDYNKIQTDQDKRLCLEKIKTYINHHNFLLKCCANLNDIYSVSLLFYFIMVVMSMCHLLYVGLEKESSVASMVRSVAYMVGITVELSIIYCLPAEYLTGEASNIAGYIYNSNWSECRFTSIRKELMVMIVRAQKDIIISAGKMMPVNLATCTQLFKTTLSFYTFLNNIRG